jgi:hypothetical protein
MARKYKRFKRAFLKDEEEDIKTLRIIACMKKMYAEERSEDCG